MDIIGLIEVESIDEFLDGFPTVTKEQVIALLEEAGKQLIGMVA